MTGNAVSPPPWKGALFLGVGAFTLSPWASPALALGLGVAFALALGNPFPARTAALAKSLLQASVIGLGFGMSLAVVWTAGVTGIGYTVAGIALTLSLGLALGLLLRVEPEVGLLVTAGTSICGGSAIAAVGPAIGAKPEAITVSLATVFLLNAVALYSFPPIGHALDLTEAQFAVWAAVAIHDTSSVVGAATAYGPAALETATVLKLARAIWIVPMALAAGAWAARRDPERRAASVKIPWFILFFVLAAGTRSVSPDAFLPVLDVLTRLAKTTLVLTLFLIGAGLSRQTLQAVGARPLILGVTLWALTGTAALMAVMRWV